MKKVFISRTLTEKSAFKKELEAQGYKTQGSSMVKFSSMDFNLDAPYDWLFFYSKTAVKYFFQKVKPQQIAGKKIATFGSSTAKALEEHKLKADFHGKGDSSAVAKEFLQVAKGQTIAFPRAKSSLKSVQKKIADKAKVVDLPVYKNIAKKEVPASNADYLVFTSPLNAKTYFKQHQIQKNQQVIAIGKTTGEALVSLTKGKVYVSDISSEENLVKMVSRVEKLSKMAQPV